MSNPPTRTPGLRPASVLIAALLLVATAGAQEDLYGPQAPRDTAWVRVLNAASDDPLVPQLDGEPWEELGYGEGTAYRPIQPGSHHMELGGAQVTLEAGPESFTTVALLPEGPLVLPDRPLEDISRGLLTLYNLTGDERLDLLAGDGTLLFEGVGPGTAESLAIAEAEVELLVRDEAGEPVGSLDSRLYARGEAHSLIVLPAGAEPRVVYLSAAAEH